MQQDLERHARRIGLWAAVWVLPAAAAASGPTSTIAHLPNVQINAGKVDTSGRHAGSKLPAPANPHPGGGFQAMFSLSAGPTPVRDMNLSFWVE